MQFNEKTFCPYIVDKSTPMKKYLYCSKLDSLCKMIEYYPNGDMVPKRNVKSLGCPYGYAIQVIEKKNMEKDSVVKKSNGLDDISVPKRTESKTKSTTNQKESTKKVGNKKNTTGARQTKNTSKTKKRATNKNS